MINNFQKLRADSEPKGRIDDITDDVLFKYSKPKQDKEPIIENNENKNTNPDNNNWRDTVVKDIKMQMRLKGLVNKINPFVQSKIIEEPKARWINNEQGITNTLKRLFGGLFVHKAEISNRDIKGILNPDLEWNGQKAEIKELITSKLDTMQQQLRKAKKQVENTGYIILDFSKSSLKNKEIFNEIEYRIKYHNINSGVIILRDGKVLKWYKIK